MMRIYITLALCSLLFVACKPKQQPHLPRQQMQEIITDIQLAEVYSTMVNDDNSANKNMDSLAYYYKTILSHHKVTMEEFKTSMQWYTANPNELDSVYINVMAEISTLEGVINASANSLPQ